MEPVKEILVFSRMHITNYGDPIIGDCCKYLIEKTAQENGIPVHVSMADVYEEDQEILKKQLEGKNAIVFPGGGLNSVSFNRKVLGILELAKQQKEMAVFFNAIGIKRTNPDPKNEKLLTKLFKRKQVIQVTTRGDYEQLLQYIIKPKKYPPKQIFDPAIWVDEAYQINKKAHRKKIGIGVIRPEIFDKKEVSVEDVFDIYTNIIRELERKNYRWELFTNGMHRDYSFGLELLNRLGRNKWLYMGRNVQDRRSLVKKIAGYQAVIASRLHANIIATSLRVPSIGLVWNEKMNLFANLIGEQDRYLNGSCLMDAPLIVGRMEEAIERGYQEQKIDALKESTIETVKNIILYTHDH